MTLSTVRQLPEEDAAIDFGAALQALRRGWYIIAGCVAAALLVAALMLHSATYRYTATMVLAPAQSSGGDGLGSRLGQLGGLASALGAGLPETNSASYRLYVEGLKSYSVAQHLAQDPALMHKLFEGEWDAAAGRWREPKGFVRSLTTGIKDLIGIPVQPWQPPGAARVQGVLERQLQVDNNPRSPVVVLRFEHSDPEFAKAFLSKVAATMDSLLRQRALARTTEYIDYLTTKLPGVQLIEQRLAITQTLAEQERIKMVASSSRPFAAETFSGPAASERPTSPSPVKTFAIALALGGGLGALIVLLRARRQYRTAAAG